MQRLLKDVGGGLLSEHLGPLTKRLDETDAGWTTQFGGGGGSIAVSGDCIASSRAGISSSGVGDVGA